MYLEWSKEAKRRRRPNSYDKLITTQGSRRNSEEGAVCFQTGQQQLLLFIFAPGVHASGFEFRSSQEAKSDSPVCTSLCDRRFQVFFWPCHNIYSSSELKQDTAWAAHGFGWPQHVDTEKIH